MSLRTPLALAAALSLGATLVVAAPAHAAPQDLFSTTTVDVVAQPAGESLFGGTAHVSATSGALQVVLGLAIGLDVVASLREGGTELTTCTITIGSTECTLSTGGLLPAGATAVTVHFTAGPNTVEYGGTVFAVTGSAPTMAIQWQDAAGTWVDGSGTTVALRGATALRCLVTNNSNAPITLASVEATANLSPAGTVTAPITGTLAAGETGTFPVWSGQASEVGSASCSGGVTLRDGTGTGNGTGGGIVPMSGTITVDRPLAPGTTVTVTGDNIQPPIVPSYIVLLDGVPVSGSPVAAPGPDYDFSLAVAIPAALAPGVHVLTVVAAFNGRDTAIAAFSFEVPEPALATTGAEADALLLVGGVLLLGGAAVLVGSRRRESTR